MTRRSLLGPPPGLFEAAAFIVLCGTLGLLISYPLAAFAGVIVAVVILLIDRAIR